MLLLAFVNNVIRRVFCETLLLFELNYTEWNFHGTFFWHGLGICVKDYHKFNMTLEIQYITDTRIATQLQSKVNRLLVREIHRQTATTLK